MFLSRHNADRRSDTFSRSLGPGPVSHGAGPSLRPYWAPCGLSASGGWCEWPQLCWISSFLQPVWVWGDLQCCLLVRGTAAFGHSSSLTLDVFGDRGATHLSPTQSSCLYTAQAQTFLGQTAGKPRKPGRGPLREAHEAEGLHLVDFWLSPPIFL